MYSRPKDQMDKFIKLEADYKSLEDDIEKYTADVVAQVMEAVSQLNDALTQAREMGAVFRVAPTIGPELKSFTESITAVQLRERLGLRHERVADDDLPMWRWTS